MASKTLPLPNSPALSGFVDVLIAEKHFDELEPEVIAEIKQDLLDRIENHINAAVLDRLPNNQVAEFERLLDNENKDSGQIQQFIQSHVPDLERLVQQTLASFRNTYLGINS